MTEVAIESPIKRETFADKVAKRIYDCIMECAADYPDEFLGGVASLVFNPALGGVKPDTVIAGNVGEPGMPVCMLQSLFSTVEFVHDLHGRQINAGARIIQKIQEEVSAGQQATGQNSSNSAVDVIDSGDGETASSGDAS